MVALVDEEDFGRVSQHKWSPRRDRATWYGMSNSRLPDGSYVVLNLHRFILRLPPGRVPEVDHIDGNGLNCRKENMRSTTRSQNAQNRHGPNQNSTTGVRGVCLDKRTGRYMARLKIQGQLIYLGSFTDLAAAEQAAIEGRKRYMTHSPECVEKAG